MITDSPVEQESPATRPVSEAVLEEARRLVKKRFLKCFWFRHPEATITNWDDVYLVVQHLREYGGHREWYEAQNLWKALSSCR